MRQYCGGLLTEESNTIIKYIIFLYLNIISIKVIVCLGSDICFDMVQGIHMFSSISVIILKRKILMGGKE
jgi:hypothetical protein